MMSMIPTSGTTSVEFLFNYIKMSFWSQYDVFGLRDDIKSFREQMTSWREGSSWTQDMRCVKLHRDALAEPILAASLSEFM